MAIRLVLVRHGLSSFNAKGLIQGRTDDSLLTDEGYEQARKAGQALSTRPDIIPPVVLEELALLQDQLPGFDCELAMACIEEDLGQPIKKIYAHLDREPISAASLGQVHKGILLNGKKVSHNNQQSPQ